MCPAACDTERRSLTTPPLTRAPRDGITTCGQTLTLAIWINLGQIGVRAWPHAVISSLGARARGGGGQAPAFRVARCRTWSSRPKSAQGRPKVSPKTTQSRPKVGSKSAQSRPKVGPKSAQSQPKVSPKAAQIRSKVGPRSAQASAQGRPKSAKIGPGPILADQSSGPVQKHQICSEMGRESTVWPETKTK